jgi:selenocysteine lyase/cysteine desulfurase
MEAGRQNSDIDRRRFIGNVGKGLGLMALSSVAVASLLEDIKAAGKSVSRMTPLEAASDEDYWATIQQAFSVTRAEDKQKTDIRKFEEIGTHSAAMRLAIGEALLFHNAIGGKRKEERLRYLSRYWMNNLKGVRGVAFNTSFDPRQSCAIANFKIEGVDPVALGGYLMAKHKIFTTPIVHDEFTGIRITPNVYTTLQELDRFCGVIADVATKGLPKA